MRHKLRPSKPPLFYKHVRHPLYIGWAIAFWATPTMTVGHLLFAAVLTGYMGLAALVEERDLVAHFGSAYEDYRRRVPMFVPRLTTLARRSRSSRHARAIELAYSASQDPCGFGDEVVSLQGSRPCRFQ
jgi:hypothetical protein